MDKQSLGTFISILRKGKGIKQEELAEKLGVSGKTISSWENDRTYPDIMMLPIIADYFDITVDELIRGVKKNIVIDKKDEEVISNKSLLKIKKLKYAKYKERNLIYILLSSFLSLITILGLYLSCFVALWTLVFAIVGVLGMATFLVLVIVNSKHYLNNEGILTSEEYVEENYDKILNCKVNIIRSFIFSFIPLFIYGLVIVSCYLWNNQIYIQEVLTVTIDLTKPAMTWGIISGLCGLIGLIIAYIVYAISNKKYGNEKQKLLNKQNNKLVIILASILVGSLTLSPIILSIHDNWGPVENIYQCDYQCDTYEEIIEKLTTYTVDINALVDAGLERGTEYVLNLPDEWVFLFDDITDLGNNFVYVKSSISTTYEVHKCDIYDDISVYYGNCTNSLIDAYLYAEDKNNIVCNYSDYKSCIIPEEVFEKKYNSEYGFYYIDLKPGEYSLGDGCILDVYTTAITYWVDSGLYYKITDDTEINNWIRCYDAEFEKINFTTYAKGDFDKARSNEYVLSNRIHKSDYYSQEYFLNISKTNLNEWRYITRGINKGKYGYCSLTSYYVSDLTGGVIVLLLCGGLLIEITIGVILWKKQKYMISFK